MRIFHLFSNHKFTGPADPVLTLARSLSARDVDLEFFPGRDPKGGNADDGVAARARRDGLTVNSSLHLYKHGKPIAALRDVLALRRWIRERRPDVIHTHLANDHLIAVLAARGSVPVVRTMYDPDLSRGFRAGVALKHTDAVVVFSSELGDRYRRAYPSLHVESTDPVLDLTRFDEPRDRTLRSEWGVPDDGFVVGVVARMQTHRLFPELIAGFARVAKIDPGLRLVVLGRGTHRETVAFQPARESGVDDQILFPGYIPSDRYPAVLPAFDALLFLVPGSDGTCRAAREALASGVPLISSRRGLLRAINEPDTTGIFVDDESPGAIAKAIQTLRDDPQLRDRLAAGARRRAHQRFDPRRQVSMLLDLYRTIRAHRSAR